METTMQTMTLLTPEEALAAMDALMNDPVTPRDLAVGESFCFGGVTVESLPGPYYDFLWETETCTKTLLVHSWNLDEALLAAQAEVVRG